MWKFDVSTCCTILETPRTTTIDHWTIGKRNSRNKKDACSIKRIAARARTFGCYQLTQEIHFLLPVKYVCMKEKRICHFPNWIILTFPKTSHERLPTMASPRCLGKLNGVAVVKSSVTFALSLEIKDNFAPFQSQSKRLNGLQNQCIWRQYTVRTISRSSNFSTFYVTPVACRMTDQRILSDAPRVHKL